MDKVVKYQKIIVDLLNEYANLGNASPGISRQVIADKERNHYQLVSLGWRDGKRFIYVVAFHFDIVDGKVWVQQNNTEAHIADELIERGIPASDIVFGYQPPFARASAGFAVA